MINTRVFLFVCVCVFLGKITVGGETDIQKEKQYFTKEKDAFVKRDRKQYMSTNIKIPFLFLHNMPFCNDFNRENGYSSIENTAMLVF